MEGQKEGRRKGEEKRELSVVEGGVYVVLGCVWESAYMWGESGWLYRGSLLTLVWLDRFCFLLGCFTELHSQFP